MANNRMMIRCKNCKEVFMLGKYYPISWAYRFDVDKYHAFLDKHDNENAVAYEGNISMDGEFYDLVYENSCDDFVWPHLKETKNG